MDQGGPFLFLKIRQKPTSPTMRDNEFISRSLMQNIDNTWNCPTIILPNKQGSNHGSLLVQRYIVFLCPLGWTLQTLQRTLDGKIARNQTIVISTNRIYSFEPRLTIRQCKTFVDQRAQTVKAKTLWKRPWT